MKIRILKVFGLMAVMLLAFTACDEDVIDMNRGEGVVPSIQNLDPAVFSEAEGTYISFDVDVQDYTGDLVVLASVDGDKSRTPVKTISNFPANVTITLAEVAQAKGVSVNDFEVGSIFNFEVQTTVGGKSYRSPASFNAPLACAYLPEAVSGDYTASSAGWAVSGPITIVADEDDPFTLYVSGLVALDGMDEDQGPLVMVVNPGNFHVTAPRTVLGTDFFGYDNVAYQGFGVLDTCTGEYDMTFTITVDQGSFGSYGFVFRPN
jgi:hypothetical protein